MSGEASEPASERRSEPWAPSGEASEPASERRSGSWAWVAGGVLAVVLFAVAGLVTPAASVTRDISLTADGPVPKTLTLKAGDRVQFVNNDSVPHQVASQSGWQYNSGPIPPGRFSSETPPLTAPGTYVYDDVRGLVFTFQGALVVPKPRPSASPTRSPHPSASPEPTETSSPQPTSAPPPPPRTSPTAEPSVSPTAGTTATPSAVPTSAPPSASPGAPAAEIRYGAQQALVQDSPHRYGLPALLAAVCLLGVTSLLLRYLLSVAPAVRDEA